MARHRGHTSARHADVIDAGTPGSVIGLVMLRAEWGQPEVPRREPIRYHEVSWNEQFIAHPAMLTRPWQQTFRPSPCNP